MNTLTAINDLNRHTKTLNQELKIKFSEIIDKGWFVLGSEVKKFESDFAAYCQNQYCVSVANGTEALELALKAIDIKPGDYVATVANAGMYSTTAILAVGAIPFYIDIELETQTMSASDLQRRLNEKTVSAIVVTHLYGKLADMQNICKIAKEKSLPIIEDCAQAHGANIKGKKAGSFGDVACFSFYPTKNLGALGDGGAVTTSSEKINNNLLLLRQYGWSKKYNVTKLGCKNSRLDEIQAAALNIKLQYLDEWNARRVQIVEMVSKKCAGLKHIIFPSQTQEGYVAHLFVVRTQYRTELAKFLINKKIPHDIHYPIPDYRQPAFENKFASLSLINTEQSTNQILTLPCFPEMTDDEVNYIADTLIEFKKCCL